MALDSSFMAGPQFATLTAHCGTMAVDSKLMAGPECPHGGTVTTAPDAGATDDAAPFMSGTRAQCRLGGRRPLINADQYDRQEAML